MMPNADLCWVDDKKIANYLLNIDDPTGRSKALFFLARGFTIDNFAEFAEALRNHPLANPIHNVVSSVYGSKYVVKCSLRTPDGKNPCISSVWIDDGTGRPKLVTAHPGQD